MKLFAVLSALLVALCWGLYGPSLANARSHQSPPAWSAFKPYIFTGVAYLVVALMGGALMMKFVTKDSFDYTGQYAPAMNWGFLAGCLGAIGAFFLTLSLTTAGGRPAYVMPIVFGGAVTVNAIAAYINLHEGERANPLMWLGMLLIVVGIFFTAGYAPHAHPPQKLTPAPQETATAKSAEAAVSDAPQAN